MQTYDFVSVGDITTDAFIELQDATVSCDVNREDCKLCVRFGDKVPYERVDVVPAVGNSSNAAVSAHRLGLTSALISNLGDDENGTSCMNALAAEGVSTELITVERGKETNYHYVLRYEEERTILVKHHSFAYAFPDIPAPTWLYLSSLGESFSYHQEIAAYLKAHPETKLAFQPGTFQITAGYEALRHIYEQTEIFFCNKEEAQRILESAETDIVALLKEMRERGPKTVVITDGPRGAHSFDGKDIWQVPMYPDPKPPVDRTGAGDAFSSTVTAALSLGKPIEDALLWGPVNSMSVVQYIGAREGLLERTALETHLKNAPAGYRVTKLKTVTATV